MISNLNRFNIVLASQSPRRQQLLSGMDVNFVVITKDVDESFPDDLPLHEVAPYLCSKKSASFSDSELPENYLLITADTVVIIGDTILNKPADEDEAASMLRMLAGNSHEVVTGVCIRCNAKQLVFSETSAVKFAALSDEEISWYVNKYRPFDKAGAYGIQEWIGYVGIEAVSGSFYNVMGLPTHRLFVELKKFNCQK